MSSWAAVPSPAQLAGELDRVGYLADDGLATAAFLALRMGRPLFCEGEPGTGKTSLALALADALGVELIRLQCHEGIDATQALYDWDFPRQLLHLRALEAASGGALDSDVAEKSLYEFEAFLLEVLGDFVVTVPELGEVRAAVPPLVVLTSNRTREVHDALKRRCLYHWLEHPDLRREIAILRRRLPGIGERLATQVASAVQRLRTAELLKPPGVAESIDWAAALIALDRTELDAESAAATLGAVLKYREDAERTIAAGLDALLA